MDKRDKLYQLHRIFKQARGRRISKAELLEQLEYSDSTLKRQTTVLRNEYGAPLEYDNERHGWYYREGESFELPGLWFNEQELYSLLVLEQLLEKVDAGLVSEQLAIAKDRIKLLLSTKIDLDKNIGDKLRLVTVFQREFNKTIFQEIAKAILEERQNDESEKRVQYQKEQGVLKTQSEIMDYEKQYKAKMYATGLDNPYLELESHSNGHKHCRYIQFGKVLEQEVEGKFDTFGLSKTATVPCF